MQAEQFLCAWKDQFNIYKSEVVISPAAAFI